MQADVCNTTKGSADTAAEDYRIQQHAMHRVMRQGSHPRCFTYFPWPCIRCTVQRLSNPKRQPSRICRVAQRVPLRLSTLPKTIGSQVKGPSLQVPYVAVTIHGKDCESSPESRTDGLLRQLGHGVSLSWARGLWRSCR
jgi:hypothetical protein